MIIDCVKKKVNRKCIKKNGMKKDGCRISLSRAPQPKLIIDFDKLSGFHIENETRCDYLFIAEPPEESAWIVLVELKKGEPKVNDIERQLQAGSKVTAMLVPNDVEVKFCPVVASGKAPSKSQRRDLRDIFIHFRGQTRPVRRIRCNDALRTVLD